MSDKLFNSMVSMRDKNNPDKTHLGLGLFIAKMITDFHQGKISIHNCKDKRGVQVEMYLPI